MSTVKPIPEGFNTLTPYLVVKNAKEAIEFYRKAFGAEVACIHEIPGVGTVLNAQLRIGDSMLMLNDEFPEYGALGPSEERPSSVTVHLYVDDADAWFERAVKAGATVTMPIDDAFWGDRFGCLTDPFGHKWSIATHLRDVTPEEMEEAAKAMMEGQPS